MLYNESLKVLLRPLGKCPLVGGREYIYEINYPMAIAVMHSNDCSSYRFMYLDSSRQPVACMQIITDHGHKKRWVTNAYTQTSYRRMGFQKKLFERAVKFFDRPIAFSEDLSESGKGLVKYLTTKHEDKIER